MMQGNKKPNNTVMILEYNLVSLLYYQFPLIQAPPPQGIATKNLLEFSMSGLSYGDDLSIAFPGL